MNEKYIADNIIKNVKIFRTRRTTGTALLIVLFVSLALVLASAFLIQAQSPNLQETLEQYILDLQNNPADNALREKIIKLAQEMKPTPAIPREAEKFLITGRNILSRMPSPMQTSPMPSRNMKKHF